MFLESMTYSDPSHNYSIVFIKVTANSNVFGKLKLDLSELANC